MYSLAWFGLLIGLLIAPALAFAPRLIFSAKTAIALPLVSSLLLYFAKEALYLASVYNTPVFRGLILLLACVAAIRVYGVSRSTALEWTPRQGFCVGFNFILLMPLLLWFWATPYDTDADAISSWEFWAQQHYLGLRPDFFYTISPYPQAFPVFISNIYTLWGSADYHSLARSLFFVFPLCLLTGISLMFAENSRAIYTPAVVSLVLYLLFFRTGFSLTNADPMMSAAVLLSAYYTLLWAQETKNDYIYLSAACALLALLTKQHAIVWAVGAWPALLIWHGWRQGQGTRALVCIAFVALAVCLWLALEGGILDAYYNKPALRQSIEGRTFAQQMLYGLSVFGYYPGTLVLLVACLIAAQRDKHAYVMLIFFILPALALWMLLGNYSVHRAGLHVVAVMALLVAFKWKEISGLLRRGKNMVPAQEGLAQMAWGSHTAWIFTALLSLVFIVLFEAINYSRSVPLEAGHRNTLIRYYESAGDLVDSVYNNPDLVILTQSAEMNSIMLRRSAVVRPSHDSTELDLLNTLHHKKVQIILPYPGFRDRSELALLIDNLAWFCKSLLVPVTPDSALNIYTVDHSQVNSCRDTLLAKKFFVSPEPFSLY